MRPRIYHQTAFQTMCYSAFLVDGDDPYINLDISGMITHAYHVLRIFIAVAVLFALRRLEYSERQT